MKSTCIICKEVVSVTSDYQNQVKVIKGDDIEVMDAEFGHKPFSDIVYDEFKAFTKTVCLCDDCYNKL